VEMLVQVAQRFRDDDAVLGYEIMNEPIGDDDAIAAFSARAAQAMRAADPRHLIVFEPSAVRNFTNSTPPSSRPFPVEGAVYAVHVYTPMTPDGIAASVLAARDEADAWRTPLLLTEAGAPSQSQ